MTALDRSRDHERKAAESFERCDTDGFVTQAAHGIMARVERLQHDIDLAGGTSEFWGLFTEDGTRVKAKIVQVPEYNGYGKVDKWIILDENDQALEWVARPKDPTNPSGRSKMGKLGLHEEREVAAAKAYIPDNGQKGFGGMATLTPAVGRLDGGYPEGAEVLR